MRVLTGCEKVAGDKQTRPLSWCYSSYPVAVLICMASSHFVHVLLHLCSCRMRTATQKVKRCGQCVPSFHVSNQR